MNAGTFIRRFLVFGPIVTLFYYLRDRALVSPKAEVELTQNLQMGVGTRIGSFTKVKASEGLIRTGRDVHVATNCFICAGKSGIEIGDDCLIGPGTSISSKNYGYSDIAVPIRLQAQQSKGIRIGSNVWIGSNVVILDGAELGNGVVVSANAVVSGKISDNAIVQGNPARVIFLRR